MSDFKIDGIVPIVPTPFFEDERPDWESLGRLIDFAYDGGACAVCLPAYASEFYKLSEEERREAVAYAVKFADGRIPVIAQVNFAAPRLAVEAALAAQKAGAAAICTAAPRLMPLGEKDLFRYFAYILERVDHPYIIQDFNPGGPTASARFVADLHRAFPHFRYIKLEEPMMAGRVHEIRKATEDGVGVLEGWGGMYLLELVSAGIAGVMPGLAVSDILGLAFREARGGDLSRAYETLAHALPQIVFSLQNMELFHHAEKRLLQARGVLSSAFVRQSNMTLSHDDDCHIDFLNSQILKSLDRLKLARNPGKR